MTDGFDWEMESAREAGVLAVAELENRRAAEARGKVVEPSPLPSPDLHPALKGLPAGSYVVGTIDHAFRLWVEHEREEARWYSPAGPVRVSAPMGVDEARQAFMYIRDVQLYRRAYPVIQWVHGSGGHPNHFGAREYCRSRGWLTRSDEGARTRLGWRLPHWRTGPIVHSAGEILAMFEARLERALAERPLVIVPPQLLGGVEIGGHVAEEVEAAARKKWGRSKSSLRERLK